MASKKKMLGVLLHLGQNMWDEEPLERAKLTPYLISRMCKDYLRCDEKVWRKITDRMAARHYNLALIDLGEGMVFPSHPELAVKGSWTPEKMQAEIRRLAEQGIEAVPKLNFATTHDTWLGEYHRMVSTPEYYQVVKDVVKDVMEVFGRPRLFHLGLDEETIGAQRRCGYKCVRQGDLLWHDYNFYFDTVRAYGSRPWMFGDAAHYQPERFYSEMPKDVLQSKAHYGHNFVVGKQKDKEHEASLASFAKVAAAGYEITGTSSNWVLKDPKTFPYPKGRDYYRDREAIEAFTEFCTATIPDAQFAGMLLAPWGEINEDLEDYWLEAVDQQADAFARRGIEV